MSVLQALILGIVQGLTELLPISSSGHLDILPWLFFFFFIAGFNEAFDGFDVALHFGTLLAIGIFFFKDWIVLIKGGYRQLVKKEKSQDGKMFWYIVAATIPGGIIGLLLDKFAGDALKQPLIIACALIIMGVILYLVDKKYPNIRAGFIHVPYIPSQVVDKPEKPSMSTIDISKGLELAIKAAVENSEDIKAVGGAIC